MIPKNIFDSTVQSLLAKLIGFKLLEIQSAAPVVEGQDTSIEVFPRVVVTSVNSVEAIYQSGNYQLTVEVKLHVNVDEAGASDVMNENSIKALWGAIIDKLQESGLQDEMNATNRVLIQGIVIGEQSLDEVAEREWIKKISIDFFGFAKSN